MDGNHKHAIQLYHWNVTLAGAMYETLNVFEVVLRNAIDRELCIWNATQTDAASGRQHGSDWLMDPSKLVSRLVQIDVLVKAKSRANRDVGAKRRISHADVLAQMPLSTWRFLLPDKDPGRQLLWAAAIKNAFPHLARPESILVQAVSGIYDIRNRVAHLEPLLDSRRTRDQLQNMRDVLKEIDPLVEQWFVSNQRVTHLLKLRPQPVTSV
jgi:hypothetical protein